MATISTKQAAVTPDTLDINSFTDEEKKALLCVLGNIRLTVGSPIRSIVKKLEKHFSDSDFEDAFDEYNFSVYLDGSLLDPGYVELEVKRA